MFVVTFTPDSHAMDFFKKTFTLDKTEKTLLHLFIEEAKKRSAGYRAATRTAAE